MKKIIIIIIVVLLAAGGYYYYKNIFLKDYIPVLETEEEKAIITEYYIYGNYLSMEGSIDKVDATYDKIDLILYNGEFKSYEIEVNKTVNKIDFSFDTEINKGMYIDDIEVGEYPMFIRLSYLDEEKSTEEEQKYTYKYYVLDNQTDYKETTYYTLSKYNNKILINSKNNYNTMMFNITKNNDQEIYDIVIDPGHGGIDGGAENKKAKLVESDVTLSFSKTLKKELENLGYTVKLTREEDSLSENDYFDEYNEGGRAVISHEVNAKYLLSIHMNSSTASYVKGFEIYTPDNIDYTLAETIRDNIIDNTDMTASTNKTHRVEDGIYTHTFSEYEIDAALKGYDNKGYKRYNVTTESNYLYMIRETGGIMTGAYVDDSNPEKVGVNPYYDSNVGTEAYLLELGYITNTKDLDIIQNKEEEYAKAIATAFNNEEIK